MITFTYEIYEADFMGSAPKRFIRWNAVWDGSLDNDPLFRHEMEDGKMSCHPFGMSCHPFGRTLEFEDTIHTGKWLKDKLDAEGYYESGLTLNGVGYKHKYNPDDWDTDKLLEIGDVVAYNSVTEALCKMLSDDELIKESSGCCDPYDYKRTLLGVLSRLWD